DDVSTEGPSGTVVPHFSDDNAYVTDGVLVAAFPRFELRASTPPDQQIMPFGLTDLHLTAEMRGGEATRGILAGRMSLASLYNIASTRGIGAGSSPVQTLIVPACQLADVAGDPSHDQAGDRVCDGSSAAISFTAAPAKLPRVAVPREAGVGTCPDV